MTDNVTDFPQKPETDFLIGPFQEWRVIVDGRIVPGLTAFEDKSFGDGISLVVDHRFSAWFPKGLARDAAYLIAQAMAVQAGYPHFCADTKDMPFARIACQMGADLQPIKPA